MASGRVRARAPGSLTSRPAAPGNSAMPRLSRSALFFKTVIESRRGDAPADADRGGIAACADGRAQPEDLHRPWSGLLANWARGKLHDPEAGAVGLKEALASYLALGNKSGAPSFHGLLAELEAMRPDLDSALATIDAGLAIAEETGEHYTDPYLHRLRGEFLLMRSPADSRSAPRKLSRPRSRSPKAQGARGYALLASRALARLYQSTGRPDEAQSDRLRPRSKAFRRRRKCLRSPRRRSSWGNWRRPAPRRFRRSPSPGHAILSARGSYTVRASGIRRGGPGRQEAIRRTAAFFAANIGWRALPR